MACAVTKLVQLKLENVKKSTCKMAMDTQQRILYICSNTLNGIVLIVYRFESSYGVGDQLLLTMPWNIAPPGIIGVVVSYLGEREKRYPIALYQEQERIYYGNDSGICVDNNGSLWIGPLRSCRHNDYEPRDYYFLNFINAREEFNFHRLSSKVHMCRFIMFDPISSEILLHQNYDYAEGYNTETHEMTLHYTHVNELPIHDDWPTSYVSLPPSNGTRHPPLLFYVSPWSQLLFRSIHSIRSFRLTQQYYLPRGSRTVIVARQDHILVVSSNGSESVLYKTLLNQPIQMTHIKATQVQRLESDQIIDKPLSITDDPLRPHLYYIATSNSVVEINTRDAINTTPWLYNFCDWLSTFMLLAVFVAFIGWLLLVWYH